MTADPPPLAREAVALAAKANAWCKALLMRVARQPASREGGGEERR